MMELPLSSWSLQEAVGIASDAEGSRLLRVGQQLKLKRSMDGDDGTCGEDGRRVADSPDR